MLYAPLINQISKRVNLPMGMSAAEVLRRYVAQVRAQMDSDDPSYADFLARYRQLSDPTDQMSIINELLQDVSLDELLDYIEAFTNGE